MKYIEAFEKETTLIEQYGKNKFFTVWAMGLYLDTSDLAQLAQDDLTDNDDDKKIDFLRYDSDDKILYVVQGYYSDKVKDSAKANKASDLNTASAWLTNGNITGFAPEMRTKVEDIRSAIVSNNLTQVELIYVHNCGESKIVETELVTAAANLKDVLKEHAIDVTHQELGSPSLERLYLKQVANIVIDDVIEYPSEPTFEESSDTDWKSVVLTVTGNWLRDLYTDYQSRLFSANYRGYLGLAKNRINKGIKQSAEHSPKKFWAFNNGITILTSSYEIKDHKTLLHGISIINGAQTTGSLGQLPNTIDLSDVKIMARVIQCSNPDLIASVVKFNNTQNKITAWDSYGNDEMQTVLQTQFKELHYDYSFKRGFDSRNSLLNIETCIQPLLSFVGKYKDANRSKTTAFETRSLYTEAYENVKARHVLFVLCLFSAISDVKIENREKIKKGENITDTDKRMYDAFAPLKSKHFFMSIIAETVKKMNTSLPSLRDISFLPNVSDCNIKSFDTLIADIKPFVRMLITNIVNYDKVNGLYSHYSDPDIVNTIANHVENQVSSLAASEESIQQRIEGFMQMVCNG